MIDPRLIDAGGRYLFPSSALGVRPRSWIAVEVTRVLRRSDGTYVEFTGAPSSPPGVGRTHDLARFCADARLPAAPL